MKHGMTQTRLYRIWRAMKNRCSDPKHPHYNDYGGRGISVCDEWKHDSKLFCDWAIANGYADRLTIDRIDVNGDYCPDNCRWITMKEQHNNRRDTIIVTYNGKTQTLSQWSEETGIYYHKLLMRYKRGWDTGRLLTKP